MADQNIGLADAYQLIADSPELTGEAINWKVVAERYRSFRVDSGTVSESNYNTNEAYRVQRAVDLIAARSGAAHDAGSLLRIYTEKHLSKIAPGSSGRKRNLLDVCRFLRFAVKRCAADKLWLPPDDEEVALLVGVRTTAKEDTPPVKPEALIRLLDSLEGNPELHLAVGLVAFYGLRPAELMTLSYEDGKLKVGNVKRNSKTAATPKKPRTARALNLRELPGEGERLVQLWHSGLVKLPTSIRNAKNFKDCGAAFGQYLDRHPFWAVVLKEEIQDLKPYSLRHGFAWRAAKYYPKPLPLRDTADLMGHDMRTHIRHYGQWTDEAGTEAAVEASILSLELAS
ncbi:MAG: site-specific integrase [Synechococcus sp. YX04-3]|nr:MAG: site-specific integrase [Synechococcus sp. YX04-3]